MFLVSFSVTSVPITHKMQFDRKYTCTVHWVGHVLTHWGRVMLIYIYIYMRQQTNHHWLRLWLVAWTAPSHYLYQCRNIVNLTLRNKLQRRFNRYSNIFIQENPFQNVVWKMAAILSRPQCVKEQKSNVVVLLKILRLSLKPKILHNFKTTWVFFKIENGPNFGNAKRLCAFTKLSIASCWKKVIESISAGSIIKIECNVWPE